jgi:peroxiredoxin
MIKPKTKTPELIVDLINDTQWELKKQEPEHFTMIVFYRGLHCPVCKKYLENIKTKLEDFSERGVNVIAISMDTERKAQKTSQEWDITSLPMGYELSEESAREWGLYISNGIKEAEPETFSEPGFFLIKPDGSLYCSSVQSMPFARPHLDDLLKAIDFVKEEDYPASGEK